MPGDPVASLDPADRAGAAALFDLIRGHIGSELLYVTAKLRLADYLAAGVRFSDEVAEQTQTHPAATHRALKGLVALGICAHDADGGFSLTALGSLLTSEHPLGYQTVAIIHADPSVMTDLLMLTVTGGHERTERQYRELLTDAGFTHVRVLLTDSPFGIVEATA